MDTGELPIIASDLLPRGPFYVLKDGEIRIYEVIQTGGIDDEGQYVLVQDGPAQGERAYV